MIQLLGIIIIITIIIIIIIIVMIIIKNEPEVHGWERVRTLSIRRPQPHTTNLWKEEKRK